MKPLVSIAIPAFNSAAWLTETIESALGQTWPEKEILVVDDGSTDDTPGLLAAFGDRIRWVRTENGGVNRARNQLLKMAHGEWVQYLDADDVLSPRKIEQQIEEAGDLAACDVIYSPVISQLWENGQRRREWVEPIDPALDVYAQWFLWQLPQTGGALWRRSLQVELGGWDETEAVCDEHEFYQRALRQGARFVFAPTPGAVYRHWSMASRCRSDERVPVVSRTKLFDQFHRWMKEQGIWTEAHRQAAGRTCFEMARTLAKHDLVEAARYHAERGENGLLHLDGPAAPVWYRLAYRTLGFAATEKLARRVRGKNGL